MGQRLAAAWIAISALLLVDGCTTKTQFVFQDRTDLAVRHPSLRKSVKCYFQAWADANVEDLYEFLHPKSKAALEEHGGGKQGFVAAVQAAKSDFRGHFVWGVLGNVKSVVVRGLRDELGIGHAAVRLTSEVTYRQPSKVVGEDASRPDEWQDLWLASGRTWACSDEEGPMWALYFAGFLSVWDPGFSFVDECDLAGKYPALASRVEEYWRAWHEGDLSLIFDFLDPQGIGELKIGPKSDWIQWNSEKGYILGYVHNLKAVKVVSYEEGRVRETVQVKVTVGFDYWRQKEEPQVVGTWVRRDGLWYLSP